MGSGELGCVGAWVERLACVGSGSFDAVEYGTSSAAVSSLIRAILACRRDRARSVSLSSRSIVSLNDREGKGGTDHFSSFSHGGSDELLDQSVTRSIIPSFATPCKPTTDGDSDDAEHVDGEGQRARCKDRADASDDECQRNDGE